jgi:hypothetical protein
VMSLRQLLEDHAYSGTEIALATMGTIEERYVASCECGTELGVVCFASFDKAHDQLRSRWSAHVIEVLLRAFVNKVLEAELAKEEISA